MLTDYGYEALPIKTLKLSNKNKMSKEKQTLENTQNGNDFIADVSISLRDRFAIAVVTGLTAATNNDGDWTTVDCEETIADMAYRIADECIKRRKQ